LLRAEALVRLGRHAEAAALIAEAADRTDGSAIEMAAEIARVTGHALAAAGDAPASRRHFERAARILATIGNRSGRADLLDNYAARLWAYAQPPSNPYVPPQPPGDLPAPPRRVTVRLDTTSPLLAGSLCPAALATDRAATIIDAGGYPEVLGQEALHLIFESACADRAALAVSQNGRPPEVVRWFGCRWSEARALVSCPPRRLEAGTWHGRTFTIAIDPPADIRRLSTLLAIERLSRSARWQHEARRNERERAALWPTEPGGEFADGIFINEEMSGIVASARKVAAVGATVLLTGETGTGKEVVARVIHAASTRGEHPFVPFNCTAVPREMIDSQLFGYRRGAFTGAVADFPGVIRAASGGTLFLDEIGELGLDVQPKLLRFIESGEIQPLGDSKPVKVDVRVVASTNAELERLVADGRFRQDLFYRLNVVRFRLPPLRERREEIPPLAEHFLQRASREFKKEQLRLSEETMEYLVLYRWPGNVRQLANEMRRVAAFAEPGALVMPEHLDPVITADRRTIPAAERTIETTEVVVRLDQPLAAAIEHLERASVQYAIRAVDGRLEEAASLLGLSRKGLYLKRQRLGLADTGA
jgi:DNA-binding NtrC family response regulator